MGEAPQANIGDLAESTFAKWCSENNILAQKAERDRLGWDFLIEFTPTTDYRDAEFPRSLQKAFVQIKGSSNGQSSRPKLSALLNLIYCDLPAFYVEINVTTQSGQFFHVWEDTIDLVLRKRFETFEKHPSAVRLSLPRNKGVPFLSGGDLLVKMSELIRTQGQEYSARKNYFRSSCGFDSESFTSTFTLDEEKQEQLMDSMLGYNQAVVVSDIKMQVTRYNHELKSLSFVMENAILKCGSEPRKGQIVFQNHRSRISISADIFDAVLPGMGPEHGQIRVRTAFLDVRYNFSDGKAKLSFAAIGPNDPIPIQTVCHAILVREMVIEGCQIKVFLDNKEIKTDDVKLSEFTPCSCERRIFVEIVQRALTEDALENCYLSITEFRASESDFTNSLGYCFLPGLSFVQKTAIKFPVVLATGIISFKEQSVGMIVKIHATEWVEINTNQMRFVGSKPDIISLFRVSGKDPNISLMHQMHLIAADLRARTDDTILEMPYQVKEN